MSYLLEGALFLPVGLFVMLLLPIGGMIIVVISIAILALGAQQEVPGQNPGRCGFLGHDWRSDIPGVPPGKTCRNCMRRADGAQVMMVAPGRFQTAGGGYVVGRGGGQASVPGYAPGASRMEQPNYYPAPMFVPPQPPPVRQCSSCGRPVPYGAPACAGCRMQQSW